MFDVSFKKVDFMYELTLSTLDN